MKTCVVSQETNALQGEIKRGTYRCDIFEVNYFTTETTGSYSYQATLLLLGAFLHELAPDGLLSASMPRKQPIFLIEDGHVNANESGLSAKVSTSKQLPVCCAKAASRGFRVMHTRGTEFFKERVFSPSIRLLVRYHVYLREACVRRLAAVRQTLLAFGVDTDVDVA